MACTCPDQVAAVLCTPTHLLGARMPGNSNPLQSVAIGLCYRATPQPMRVMVLTNSYCQTIWRTWRHWASQYWPHVHRFYTVHRVWRTLDRQPLQTPRPTPLAAV